MNKSSIEWTEYTSNPIQAYVDGKRGWFCEKVSPGCAHCYSSTQNEVARWGGNGLEFLPANREKVTFRLNEAELKDWSASNSRTKQPKYTGRCFAFDMTDLFGEWVSDEWLAEIFAAMGHAPNLEFQILTKRPERMNDFVRKAYHPGFDAWPLPNVWLGVTVENQRWADSRIPILLDTPAAVRFVSAEPLLQKIELWKYMDAWKDISVGTIYERTSIDWVIVGGESGSKHRPFDAAWAESLVDQGHDFGVPIFVKQLGGARPGNRLEDLPPSLRVRQFPR